MYEIWKKIEILDYNNECKIEKLFKEYRWISLIVLVDCFCSLKSKKIKNKIKFEIFKKLLNLESIKIFFEKGVDWFGFFM